MRTFYCTPRGDVFELPCHGVSLRWTERIVDDVTGLVLESTHTVAYGRLPIRDARDIYEARVDFAFDQAEKDTLADIRRMFRFAAYDQWALEYRKTHRRMPGSFGICVDG